MADEVAVMIDARHALRARPRRPRTSTSRATSGPGRSSRRPNRRSVDQVLVGRGVLLDLTKRPRSTPGCFIGAIDDGRHEDASRPKRSAHADGKALIDSELAVQDLTVDDDTRDQAADDLEAGDVPDDVDAIVDGEEELGDDAFDEVADALAAYTTLDEWLRTIDPADTELHDRILAEHPEVADAICGSAVVGRRGGRAAVRDQLKAGASLDQIADDVATLSRTPAGGECLTPRAVPPAARRPAVRDAGRFGGREDGRVTFDGAAGGVLRDADRPGRRRPAPTWTPP